MHQLIKGVKALFRAPANASDLGEALRKRNMERAFRAQGYSLKEAKRLVAAKGK